VLGTGIFGSFRAGLWLWLIHIAAALTAGLLAGRPRRDTARRSSRTPASFRAAGIASVFVTAVQTALRSILNVCAFVVVFSVLSLPFRAMGGTVGALASGLLELFSTLPLIPTNRIGFVLAAGLAGWGGVSVLCQTAALTADTGLSLRRCALGKAVQGLLSALLAFLCTGFVFP